MATPGEAERLRDQVINKITIAHQSTLPPDKNSTDVSASNGARVFSKILEDQGAPPVSTKDLGVAPSKVDGNVVFSLNIEPEKRAQVEAVIKKMGGEFFPDSEQGPGFTNDVRMPKAVFDKAMEKSYGIPADINPVPAITGLKYQKAAPGK